MDLDTVLWDKTKPPAWAQPFVPLLAGANPSLRNVLLHTMRHASEANAQTETVAAELATARAELAKLTADPADSGEAHPIVAAVRYASAHPTP